MVTGVSMQIRSVDFFDESDDSELLARARNGDTQCADILWIRVRPAVLAAARGIADNQHDAEDLASEAMTKVFAAIADGAGPTDSVLPYLYATMRNLHISSLRRLSRVGTPLELNEQRVLNLVTTEPDAIESELVSRAFKNLPDRWRYVLWAGLVEGRPGGEIAEELQIKPAAVHALKSRALEGLRQQYLSEHAKLSEEQECAEVHRVLAAIARGRARQSTDLNHVWRHLRGCEHCAEGYREITAINSQIGALLGPAAAASVVLLPQTPLAGLLGLLRVPEAASKAVAAAGVAGVIAVSGATLAYDGHPEAAPSQMAQVAVPPDPKVAPPAAGDRSVKPRVAANGGRASASPDQRCTPVGDPSPWLNGAALDPARPLESALDPSILPEFDSQDVPQVLPDTCATDVPRPPSAAAVDPADVISQLVAPQRLSRQGLTERVVEPVAGLVSKTVQQGPLADLPSTPLVPSE